jgi:hypothetical protein
MQMLFRPILKLETAKRTQRSSPQSNSCEESDRAKHQKMQSMEALTNDPKTWNTQTTLLGISNVQTMLFRPVSKLDAPKRTQRPSPQLNSTKESDRAKHQKMQSMPLAK